MSEPRTIRVKDGGFVSLERGPDEKDWTRFEVARPTGQWRSASP